MDNKYIVVIRFLKHIGLAITFLPNFIYAANIQRFSGISFSNPAQLTQIKDKQFVLGAIEGGGPPIFSGSSFGMNGTERAIQNYFLPYFQYATRLHNFSDKWFFGFNITRPFASNQYWGNDPIVNLATVSTTWGSVDFSPNISYEISKLLSVGAGYDAMYFTYITNVMKKLSNSALGLLVRNYNGWGYGWHAGLVYKINDSTNVGLTYYSGIKENLHGFSSLPGKTTTGTWLSIRLPDTVILTLKYIVNPKWTTTGTMSHTWWHFHTLSYINTAVGNSNTGYNFRNTVRFAWDNQYAIQDIYKLRGGVYWDQGPTNNVDRTINTSTVDTIGLVLGLHIQVNKPLGIAINYGFSRYFHEAPIKNVTSLSFGRVSLYNNSVEGRLTWDI